MFRLSALALIAASAAVAAPVPKEKGKELYFPTAVGDTLEMVAETAGVPAALSRFVQTVTKVEGGDGKYVVTVEAELVRGGKRVSQYEVSANGVFALSGGGVKYDPPAPQIKLTAKPGDTWETVSPKGTATMGKEEEIEVPAGKYKAIRVEAELDVGGRTQKMTNWYAPGVGVVKMVINPGDKREVVHVLKAFTPGKSEKKDEPKKDK